MLNAPALAVHVGAACLHHGSAPGQLHASRTDAVRDPRRHQPRHLPPGSAFRPAPDAPERARTDPDRHRPQALRRGADAVTGD
ncbi:hypothetical protein G6F61_014852 [Rhizopus arrhizus]|nr:hypothetical protein G6F61_014852 [Rhizopus arrhizus]